ncbi:TonB-dependent receptor domain-containing protein [Phenylobacterium sp.]|uniref:TonB-dependent receptor domain-containing protein n=1 Tax=Phenylobacterium sp. TaxID=1871053 RepID=UPI002735F51D|nr:TonB-dependent receptor [Phenylobacterium sp.]MDP3660923.1 TonB-dependent receptor [Phenylobacterium sp.]
MTHPLQASAADAAAPATVDEVVVTGSFIVGTPEDAALPVNVISADTLQRRGSPNIIETMKELPANGGINGQQTFDTGAGVAPYGVVSANLRNLGPARTLVLLNGKRLTGVPTRNTFVDVGSLPQAAIGRVEVLKDGAAATYGSDAIGGVVNFITRKNYDGLLLSGSVKFVPDAEDPDYNLSAVYGYNTDRGNILLSVGWQTQGKLRGNARSFNRRAYLQNPEGTWSPANTPGAFFPVVNGAVQTAAASVIRDPGCATLGAQPGFSTSQGSTAVGGQACYSRLSTVFSFLANPETHLQLYGETNFDLSDTLKFHGEALYAESTSLTANSPTYPTTNPPPDAATSPFPGFYYIPASNPGLALLRTQFPNAIPAAATGVAFAGVTFRPVGPSGLPLASGLPDEEGGPRLNHLVFKSYRLSGGFSGKMFDDIGWDLSATYHAMNYHDRGYDQITYRQQLALRGYGSLAGSPTCTSAVTNGFTTNAGNTAVGCYYLNPFSNNFANFSPVGLVTPGQANPLFSPSVANNPQLIRWIHGDTLIDNTTRLFVVDGVMNGQLPFIELPGGKVGWAAGGQFRRNFYRASYGALNDVNVTPCPNTLLDGLINCTNKAGPFVLGGLSTPTNVVQNVYAAFAELNLPITDGIGAHVAARYERYGGGSDTFNPKLDLRWKVFDWLALRGSVGTTFRAPPLQYLDPSPTNTVAQVSGFYRASITAGNPNLQPEKATTYSVGAIFKAGPARATLDYWNFDFTQPFVQEGLAPLIAAMFPANSSVNCGNPAFAQLQARFTFSPNVCAVANIATIFTQYTNAGGVKTDGFDFSGSIEVDQVFDAFRDVTGAEFTLGTDVTFTNKYQVARVVTPQGLVLGQAFNAVGKLNFQTGYFALPRWKGSVYAEFTRGPNNLRIQTNIVGAYRDQRPAVFIGNLATGDVATAAQATITPRSLDGQSIKAYITTDLTYRLQLPWDSTVVLNIANVFDTDPPLARVDYSYDPGNADPYGRTYKIALTKKF